MKPYILSSRPNECFALRSYLCIQTYFANNTPPAYHDSIQVTNKDFEVLTEIIPTSCCVNVHCNNDSQAYHHSLTVRNRLYVWVTCSTILLIFDALYGMLLFVSIYLSLSMVKLFVPTKGS